MRRVTRVVTMGSWLLSAALAQSPQVADLDLLVRAGNSFAIALHGKLATTGNPTASPASLWLAMGMLLPATRGTTATELATALQLPDELRGERLLRAVATLRLRMLPADTQPAAETRFIHDMWTAIVVPVQPEFGPQLAHFGGALHKLPFATDPHAARATINAHVQKATNDRIRNLLGPDAIANDTGIVVTTALLVTANWIQPFHAPATKDDAFTLADGSAVMVLMMGANRPHLYAEGDAWQFIDLPLEGALHLECILPREGKSLFAAERALLDGTAAKQATAARVDLRLPRVAVDGAVQAREAFAALGARTVFTDDADFQGLTMQSLRLAEVGHRTSIRIDEHGIEAAAASSARGPTTGQVELESKSFHAVRPFAFVLRERTTGLILFFGRVDDPR